MNKNSESSTVIKDIQRRLSRGETRETIAEAMGYKNYRSLHTYMTRKGYTWDPHQGKYISGMQKQEKTPPYTSPSLFDEKAERIIALLEQGMDAKQVAKLLNFPRYLEMAAYMSEKGYRWDPIQQNYIPEQPRNLRKEKNIHTDEATCPEPTQTKPEQTALAWLKSIDNCLSTIQWLIANRGKLEQLINIRDKQSEVKTYQIPGKKVSTTVQAPQSLRNLVEKFSQENDIRDIDLLQTAVVEYLKVHGYEKEVTTLLN